MPVLTRHFLVIPLIAAVLLPLAGEGRAAGLSALELDGRYRMLRVEAERLAGEPGDIPQRVRAMREIYLQSGGNHEFPLIASHGALWAYGYFERGGRLGEIISYRYFYDGEERERRLAMLESFAEKFKATNRQVFIDTYANFFFSRDYGRLPGAERFIAPELLTKLNRAHAAAASGRLLPASERRDLFVAALKWEQETTVARAVEGAVAEFDCPILRALTLKPVVQFAYFPATTAFFFEDFSAKDERIARAIASYDLAVGAGWDRVLASLADYDVPGVF